jgi:hypothetical protein
MQHFIHFLNVNNPLKPYIKATVSILCMLFILVISGCKKSSDNCPSVFIMIPPSVDAGGTIHLNAGTSGYILRYFWSGPNGFTSTEESPEITSVQANNAGRYTLKADMSNGCTQNATSDSLIVNTPPAPCSPGNNTGNISGATSLTFYGVVGAPSGGSYFITANGSNGDLELEFPGTARPVAGVYNIQSLGGSWLNGDVRMRFVSLSANWASASGKVFVTINNNKVTATFCSVPVSNQTFNYNATASARITEQ